MWKQPGLINTRAIDLATKNNQPANANANRIPQSNDVDIAETEAWVQMRNKAAIMILSGTGNMRFGPLKNYLENRFTINKVANTRPTPPGSSVKPRE